MAVVKVSIKDKNTLELQEDAKKGDTIDLGCLSSADVSSVSESMKQAALKEAEEKIAKAKAKELEAELLKQEKEISAAYQAQLKTLEVDKYKYELIAKKAEEDSAKLKFEQEKLLENEKKLKQIEINNSVAEKDKEILSLKAELGKKDDAIKLELERKATAVTTLEERIKHQEKERALETERVLNDIKREKEKLEAVLSTKDTEYLLKEKTLKEQLESKIKEKEDEVAYY